MDESANQFVAILSKLGQEKGDDASLVDELYDAVDLLDGSDTVNEVYPAIFDLFERCPSANFGMPGPLVHLVEKSFPGGYEKLLLASLARKPVHHTVWMANRLLNANDIDNSMRSQLQLAIQKTINHPSADDTAKQVAAQFMKHHGL